MKVLESTAPPLPIGERVGERGLSSHSLWREWRLPLLVGVALAVITGIPYVAAYLSQPPGHVFVGFFYLWDDATTYMASSSGRWAIPSGSATRPKASTCACPSSAPSIRCWPCRISHGLPCSPP